MSTIEELRALLKAGTPGPWIVTVGEDVSVDADNAYGLDEPGTVANLGMASGPRVTDDAALIAAAVNSLSVLLDIADLAAGMMPHDAWTADHSLEGIREWLRQWHAEHPVTAGG